MRQEFVIGGWTEGDGARKGHVGALLLGFYGSREDPRKLVFAGRCGSGFGDALLDTRKVQLARRAQKACPFDSSIANDEAGGVVHFVKPDLVGEAEFSGLTRHHVLRQAAFKGLRTDKPAKQVVWEQAEVTPWHAQSGADPSTSAS
jgi:bifunctional non-homologous end joining protein LigD